MRSRTTMVAAATFMLGATVLAPATAAAPAAPATQPYVVLSVSQSGGFVPMEWAHMRTPQAVLYSDGTLLATSLVTTAIYPGPAAPTVLRKVAPGSIQLILAAADAAKVTDPKFDWGIPGVADVPSTDFISQRAPKGPTTFVSVYALGMTGPGLTRTQVAARKAAAGLVSDLTSFSGTLIPTKSMPTRWVSPRWAFWATPAQADEFSVVRRWFGAKPLRESTTCVDFTTTENRTLVSLLPKLNQASRWLSDGKTWQLRLRPLFPHEAGCAAQR
ncbi:MAG: hypothetical protein KGP01_02570 [Actinomycetales bacterium]|nr:hypothetical protein [Actinomycetales bacterium]